MPMFTSESVGLLRLLLRCFCSVTPPEKPAEVCDLVIGDPGAAPCETALRVDVGGLGGLSSFLCI